MDAIELARREGERLHLAGAALADDPWSPYAFVVAQAGRQGFSVQRLASDSPLLDGALARFDSDADLILHADGCTMFEQAVYVAHELGHAILGDGAPVEPCEIDPSRPAETAPVGEDRVLDYSRRQRREVQMDLFARELILPRSVARRLHVEEGLTAGTIAERLGASFAVIAQQLLDALLLPAIEPRLETAEPPAVELDPSQIAAAGHRGGPMLVEAGPGTGKTRTLVDRIDGLLAEGVDPRDFLVLTFSNKAAGELAERIGAKRSEEAAAMWVGTFHAFGLDLVRRHHAALGFRAEPRVMDRVEAIELLEPESTRLGLSHYKDLWNPARKLSDILGAISRAQDELVDPEAYARLAEAMASAAGDDPARRIAAEKAAEIARVYARYQAIKREKNAVDFGDLITLPIDLLRDHPEVLADLQSRYRHILVDEYQDVNRASVELLKCLSPQGLNLWVVGDVRQSIYRFRGASPFNVDRFGLEDWPGGMRPRLEVNYRSRTEIVDAYTAFARDMTAGAGRAPSLRARRGASGHPVQNRRFLDTDGEAPALAEAIQEMRDAGFAWRDQAILCSGNDRLGRLGSELERRGVPVLYLGSLFERPEIQDLLSWLSLLTDPRAMGLVRATPLSEGLALADVHGLLAALRSEDHVPMGWGARPPNEATPSGGEALVRIATALRGFTPADDPWTILASVLLDRTRLAADIAGATETAHRARGIAIWQFMNFLRTQPGGGGHDPVRRLLDRIRRLVSLGDERDLRQLPAAAQGIDAVRLMTMHGSKGLEFPVVHLPGLNLNALPRAFITPACPPPDGLAGEPGMRALDLLKASHEDEQECLFYVALSRARDRLLLYSARQTKSSGNRKPAVRQPSPFVARAIGAGETLIEPAFAPDRRPEDEPVVLSFANRPAFALHELALYEKCPRRFLYSVILAVGGGGGSRSGLMRTHDLVRDLLNGVIRDQADAEAHDRLEAAWRESDLAVHDYAEDFKRIAADLVTAFLESLEGRPGRAGERVQAGLTEADIHLLPDDIREGPDGLVVRRIRTGHRSKTSAGRKSEALFPMAVAETLPGARAQTVYLGDGDVEDMDLPDVRKMQDRRAAMDVLLADIANGWFPTKESPFHCPFCPAFFVCGPVPPGPLQK